MFFVEILELFFFLFFCSFFFLIMGREYLEFLFFVEGEFFDFRIFLGGVFLMLEMGRG